tara:strand:- start:49651 stop:51255 length:1605 start_codon:yes stop_codon:yes gene_type:complete
MSAKPLTVTLACLNPVVGDIKGNASQMLSCLEEHDGKTDLVIFPELFLCGYPPEDLLNVPGFIMQIEGQIETLLESTRELPAFLLPVPEREGDTLYNSVHLCEGGKIIHTHRKVELPNYGVFDEKRYFKTGNTPQCATFKGHRIGFMICEDMWLSDVAEKLKQDGAEFLITVSASPYTETKAVQREVIMQNRFTETKLPHLALNLLGGQDELIFDGGAHMIDRNGNFTNLIPAFTAQTLSLSTDNLENGNAPNLLVDKTSREESLYSAIKMGLRDYVVKNGFSSVLLGLSGGIDSALTAVVAVDALGAEHVKAFFLPSRFSSEQSLKDAQDCANALGIPCENLPLAAYTSAFEDMFPNMEGLPHENMQARLRALLLMAQSNHSGALLLSTSNKSEIAVGYTTLYGDMSGAFAPLKDLYKTDVVALSHWRNTQGPAIPATIITKPPTAELRDNQKDTDSLPSYNVLDMLLKAFIEERKTPAEIEESTLSKDEITRIYKLLQRSEYKRRQAAPGPKLTAMSFGRDWRMPLTNRFTG